jgi:hypothetical protein
MQETHLAGESSLALTKRCRATALQKNGAGAAKGTKVSVPISGIRKRKSADGASDTVIVGSTIVTMPTRGRFERKSADKSVCATGR